MYKVESYSWPHEVILWLNENTTGTYYYNWHDAAAEKRDSFIYQFEKLEDAILFKLKWS